MSDPSLNPFLLAANVPHPDSRLLPLLRATPSLASGQDEHGYSLLHAAASYNHVDLLRILVNEFKVDINLVDEDGETCLFVAETEEVAKCLLEDLKIDASVTNDEGQTAAEKILSEGDFPEVAKYLQERATHDSGDPASRIEAARQVINGGPPPPLPPGMHINLQSVTEDQLGRPGQDEPDPEFRRRIEELAAKENFDTEEGQQELRSLITDAVRGVNTGGRDVRQRTE